MGGHLATCTLVQVPRSLTLARARSRIRGKVHVVTHLNARLGYFDNLRHQVLVRHLQIFVL